MAPYIHLPLNNPWDLHLHIAYHYGEMYVNNAPPYKPDELSTSVCSPLSFPINKEHSHIKTTWAVAFYLFPPVPAP